MKHYAVKKCNGTLMFQIKVTVALVFYKTFIFTQKKLDHIQCHSYRFSSDFL